MDIDGENQEQPDLEGENQKNRGRPEDVGEDDRGEFETRVQRTGFDVEDYAREENRIRSAASDENPDVFRKSRAFETSVISTLKANREAVRDPLTGLLNRRGYIMEMDHRQREAAGAHEAGRRKTDGKESAHPYHFSLVSFDVDHFKLINDTHGHLVGDQILQEVARRVEKSLRHGDVVARTGGEEFIVIADEANGSAPALAERLRKLIADTPFRIGNKTISVTISLGVAPYNLLTKEMEEQADKALYAAKGGQREEPDRNQVWVWDSAAGYPVKYEPKNEPPEDRDGDFLAA